MRLDLEYIKQILQIIEDDDNNDMVSLGHIKSEITSFNSSNTTSDLELKKLRKHLHDLRDLGCISCDSPNLGFRESVSGNQICITANDSVRYRMTFLGHKLSDSMKNDTLWNKIKSNVQIITLETLKTLPALAIEMLLTPKQALLGG